MSTEDKKSRRLSVLLDDEEMELVENIQSESGVSKAEVVREALEYLRKVKTGDISPGSLETLLGFLEAEDHILMDAELLRSLFMENEDYSESFWNRVEEIATEKCKIDGERGIRGVESILERNEKTNMYNLSTESDGVYTLAVQIREMMDFIHFFFEKYFEASDYDVELDKGPGRIRVQEPSKI